jgi:hypothetical protein
MRSPTGYHENTNSENTKPATYMFLFRDFVFRDFVPWFVLQQRFTRA